MNEIWTPMFSISSKDEGGGSSQVSLKTSMEFLALYEGFLILLTKERLFYLNANVHMHCRYYACNKLGHALELPLHWKDTKIRSFVNEEEHEPSLCLKLAKLDFNMVQATHQRDLRKASKVKGMKPEN
ncbi:camphene/tricyclene synthase, chloroplastic-like protein [Cinnamomum micranthum f. kanehirae]|uniref:Camphene/tricyclene synthase, chloroplastic-like protein n=1 Tax=Cinnamomum micranthum f. kanehirae TaxID=337451 RepID=A0A443Q4L6_9MAGN|nr:camphene/tricyclene synthase, chloroplastic-like protein [Cinnamomum micranthum f. kanehirae]